MKFNQLVQSILVEKRCEGSLPELTSKREVYTMTVYMGDYHINPNPWKYQQDELRDWDNNYYHHTSAKLFCSTNLLGVALMHFKDAHRLFHIKRFDSPIGKLWPKEIPVHVIQTIVDRIGDLKGKWKVITDTDSDSLTIGVEIDMLHYRTQGMQDAVASNLDDDSQDISDW